MKKVLAMFILGATIALPAAGAFAANDQQDMGQTPGSVVQTQPMTPADQGVLSGPSPFAPYYGPYHQQRWQNMGH